MKKPKLPEKLIALDNKLKSMNFFDALQLITENRLHSSEVPTYLTTCSLDRCHFGEIPIRYKVINHGENVVMLFPEAGHKTDMYMDGNTFVSRQEYYNKPTIRLFLAYFDEETGTCYKAILTNSYTDSLGDEIVPSRSPRINGHCSMDSFPTYDTLKNRTRHPSEMPEAYCSQKFTLSEWTQITKLEMYTDEFVFVNGMAYDLLRDYRTYCYDYFFNDLGYNSYCTMEGIAVRLLVCPQLEQLAKAGYPFALNFVNVRNYYGFKGSIQQFNRLCQKGTNLKEIFKAPKIVYQTLLNETDLGVWDTYRKLAKSDIISKELVAEIYNNGFNSQDLEKARMIINFEFEGRHLFTWHSLQSYLHRINMYEAIGTTEGLQLLLDYFRGCKAAGIKPRTDSDSLKREHDVVARICREIREKETVDSFNASCTKYKEDNYEDNRFLIRSFEDYDDLIDEANQQCNCVASYARDITKGKALVYVLRRKACPNKSYVTVQLSLDKKHVIQARLAWNKPHGSPAVDHFLHNWINELNRRERAKKQEKSKKVARVTLPSCNEQLSFSM